MNGVMFDHNSVRLAEVTDGTSNTFIFSEHAHGILDAESQAYLQWWQTGWWSDAFFDTNYTINAHRRFAKEIVQDGWFWVPLESASSFHPGGANFAFTDGSVKFLKETIASWEIDYADLGSPLGVTYGPCGEFLMGNARPQVYQALSTRNGGEVISHDSL
jgi:prepilin-type processing-associated H-X9-DG protein